MNLACQKPLGQITKKSGIWVDPPPPPVFFQNSHILPFFLATSLKDDYDDYKTRSWKQSQDSGHYNCSSQRGLKNSLNLVVTGPADMDDDDDDVMMIGDTWCYLMMTIDDDTKIMFTSIPELSCPPLVAGKEVTTHLIFIIFASQLLSSLSWPSWESHLRLYSPHYCRHN